MSKSKSSDYQFLNICPAEATQINLLFAAKFSSLEEAAFEVGLDKRTIAKFLGGRVVRRKHFLELCKILGIAPLVAAGAQAAAVAKNEPLDFPKDLRNVEADEAMAFVQQQRTLGRVVQLTEHDSNICRFTSKEMPPERLGSSDLGILKNHNYFHSWEKADSLEKYFEMRNFLEKDGYIPGYVYRLVRTGDGALVEYSCDFHLVQDLLGKPVRIVSSDPQAFRVIAA